MDALVWLWHADCCIVAGYREVFCKEMPYRYKQFLEAGTMDDVIPRDYVHVFIIRDPNKSVPSHYKLSVDGKAVPTGQFSRFRVHCRYFRELTPSTAMLRKQTPCLVRKPCWGLI